MHTSRPTTWTIALPAGVSLPNANHRGHWTDRARTTRTLRQMARLLALQQQIPALDQVRIVAEYRPADRRRRDPANLYPAVKAVVDGLVDAGIVPDDDAAHVLGPDMRLGAVTPRGQLLIHIHKIGDPFMSETTTNDPTARDIHELLIRIETKLDVTLDRLTPKPAPEPTPEEIAGLLDQINGVRDRLIAGFDEVLSLLKSGK